MDPNEVRNDLHADQINAPVVQAQNIRDVHFHAPAPAPLERAARELAAAVRRQWTTEAEKRALRQPAPLRVRFAGMHGDVREVSGMFRQLERRQLVVLGEPGAGKTVAALLLTLELLEHAVDHEPVPILLAAASWDPKAEHFDTWATRRLNEDYPALGNVRAYGKDAAARLVAEGRVMIVVDGLDELPAHLHAAALDGLNRSAGIRPVVVTCRSAEYRAAVAHFGTFLSGAAVVELAPVAAHDVSAYLAETQLDARWTPVLDALREEHSPVALALSSPLMVYLARTIYRAPYTNPAELLRFPVREDVEQHLLRAYLPAVYEQRPQAVDPYRPTPKTPQWTLAEAWRWLRFLALRPGQDFQWWHLTAAVPRVLTAAATSVVVTGLYVLVEVLLSRSENGVGLAYLAGIVCCVAVLVRRRPIRPGKPAKARLGREYLQRTVGILAACGFLAAIVAVDGKLFLAGLTVMLVVWVIVLREATRRRSDTLTDPDGRTILRDDRMLCLIWSVLGLAMQAALFATEVLKWRSLTTTLLVLSIGCAAAAARTAWASYLVAKLWLAPRRRIPWRLMAFVEDAHRRGVLRANGPAYQFRHVRLQEHLTAS